MKMLLIAGHGQGDPGAIGYGRSECNLTRNLAVTIQQENLERNNELEITLYDTTKDCYQQSKNGIIPAYGLYDYVLEIHFNAHSDASAHGSEILIHVEEPAHTVEDTILKNLEVLGLSNRGVKRQSDLLNMYNCRAKGVSYALLETCFITNAADLEFYIRNYQTIAEAVLDGILDGFGLSRGIEFEESELFHVQVGAFQNRENAERLANELRGKGYESYITR